MHAKIRCVCCVGELWGDLGAPSGEVMLSAQQTSDLAELVRELLGNEPTFYGASYEYVPATSQGMVPSLESTSIELKCLIPVYARTPATDNPEWEVKDCSAQRSQVRQ